MDDILSLFNPVAGIYLLISAAFGKSKMFHNEYPKCSPELYRKRMRILCAASGVLLLASSALTLSGVVDPTSVWGWVIWGVGLASLLAIMGFSIAMTDRAKARAASEQDDRNSGRRPGSTSKMPEDAFSFGRDDAAPETNGHTDRAE